MSETKRTISISLETARGWYESGEESLKKIALQAFTEKELQRPDWMKIKSFRDVLKYLGKDPEEVKDNLETLNKISPHSGAIYKLDLIKEALNGDWRNKLFDSIGENTYYPQIEIGLPKVFKNGGVLGRFFTKYNGVEYVLVPRNRSTTSCGSWGVCSSDGRVKSYLGILGCKSSEIAEHFGRYFAREIFDACYAVYHDKYEWVDLDPLQL